jgi:hypothetical protein
MLREIRPAIILLLLLTAISGGARRRSPLSTRHSTNRPGRPRYTELAPTRFKDFWK